MAIAIETRDMLQIRNALAALPLHQRGDIPTSICEILGTYQLYPAIKRLVNDYNTTPRSGYCTPSLIDELKNGPASGSLLDKTSRSRLLTTLAEVAACADWLPLSGFCFASSTSQQPISVTCVELLIYHS
jgi:hypothetical protein